jgi:hypothetical protein
MIVGWALRNGRVVCRRRPCIAAVPHYARLWRALRAIEAAGHACFYCEEPLVAMTPVTVPWRSVIIGGGLRY